MLLILAGGLWRGEKMAAAGIKKNKKIACTSGGF
jgi:hypothetical protein